jgi:predicted amidohydrolase
MEHVCGDKPANWAKIETFAGQAARVGVTMLAFPECCITGYWFLRKCTREHVANLAEEVPAGPSTQRLVGLAMKHGMTVGAGLVEIATDGRMYNTYVVAMCNGEVRKHRKIHAFENDCISAGDAYTVFDTPDGVRAGILICYDNNIIENVRMMGLMGVDVLLAPHQTGGCDTVSPHGMKPVDKLVWERRQEDPEALRREFTGEKGRGWLLRWLPARAHDNGLFILFSNGVGRDDDEIRTGNAMILDPYGRILKESVAIEDDLVIADLDPTLLQNCTGRRWMLSRRPELYAFLATKTGKERPTHLVRFGKEK